MLLKIEVTVKLTRRTNKNYCEGCRNRTTPKTSSLRTV